MIARCSNPKNTAFKNYGGRGITVCEEWQTFEGFYVWVQDQDWSSEKELDRIDNDGNYEPSNCRFVLVKENARNKRNSLYASAFGETKLLVEWSEDSRCSVSYRVLRQRIVRNGWDAERAITEVPHVGN